ncbi:MAG: alkylmercury lyase MerB [Planctomycetota bacterium]|nr:alkylmercury lyase MerB [Planctomycetota bacterium]
MQSSTASFQELAKGILSVLPKLDSDGRRVSIQLYRLLAKGEPVSNQSLAEAAQVPPQTIDRLLDSWPGVYRNDEGEVVGYWGLAIQDTEHRLDVDGKTLYTWCAWDTLFIPQILQKTANVESKCPVTGVPVRLTVGPEGVRASDPVEAVVSLLVPDPEEFEDNIISSFCHHILFFKSAGVAADWVAQHEGTVIISLDEAFDLGRLKNEAQYGDMLK